MKRARRNKNVAQQCKFYEVENIFEYMVSVCINGNIIHFRELHKELCTDTKRQFLEYLFDEVPHIYHLEMLKTTIYLNR